MAVIANVIGWIAWIAAIGRLVSLYSILNPDTIEHFDEGTKFSYGIYMLFLLGIIVITNGFFFFHESKLHILWAWPLAFLMRWFCQKYMPWS